MLKFLLTPDPVAGGNEPAKPSPEAKPEPPAATSIVLDGKKSEREIQLEAEVATLKANQKKLETDNAHLADKVNQLKHPAPAPSKPAVATPAQSQAKAKGGNTFFG